MLALYGRLDAGNAPDTGCCHDGARHYVNELQLLQIWVSEGNEWVRLRELEGPLYDFEGEHHRRPAIEYVQRAGQEDQYRELHSSMNESGLAALFTRVGYEWPDIAAKAVLKPNRFLKRL